MIEEVLKPEQRMRTFRSRLNALPLETKRALGELPEHITLTASGRQTRAVEILNDSKIEWVNIGTGTNRFIIKYDGYAIKIALDREGVADNKQEFAICESLAPDIAYAHEISSGGHLLVSSYCPAFTSYSEMWQHATKIKKILSKWGKRFLLGDVGLSPVNYANWGLDPSGNPVCIDYAYIFPASLDMFKCTCGHHTLDFADGTFSKYKCPVCKMVYEDRELRARISQADRLRLFENTKGIIMSKEYEDHEVDARYIKTEQCEYAMEVADTLLNRKLGRPTANWY